jgi:transcriptional enhancer factor
VPDVKPNYEYFSELLTLQSSIMVRPKTCEVFVSSPDIQIRDDVAFDAHDNPLDQASFPHLNKYINCDDKPNVLGKDVLLHEYTRSLDRSTSACVKTVTRRWQKDAPALYDILDLPTRDDQCLLLEMCATLELHEQAKFPSGSELTGFVEVAITQPGLQNHRWKCITKLTRPAELRSEDSQPEVYTNDSGIHHRGCSDRRADCDCPARPRQDIHVPFPAVEWASILSMAVQYPDVEHQRKKDKRNKQGEGDDKKHELDRAGSKRKRSEDEGDAASWSRRELTGSDLICRVAMYQELWSCPPDSNQWKRQAIIFWRFNTTNQWYKYNPVFRPAGTTWRWLTVNDPMSRYHQQRALVYPSSLARDSVMSPTPSVNQHLTAAMNETLGHAWDGGVSLGHVPGSNSMGLFDSFPGGLATPPPTASLHGSYSTSGSFDAGSAVGGFLPSTCSGDNQPTALAQSHAYFDGAQAPTTFDDVKPMAAAVNPYMSSGTGSIDLSGQLVYENSGVPGQSDAVAQNGLHGWDMSALDGWATGAAAPKMDQAAGLWNPVHWGQAPSTARPGPGNTSVAAPSGPDGSPRAVKRRRPDGLGHMPVTAGW